MTTTTTIHDSSYRLFIAFKRSRLSTRQQKSPPMIGYTQCQHTTLCYVRFFNKNILAISVVNSLPSLSFLIFILVCLSVWFCIFFVILFHFVSLSYWFVYDLSFFDDAAFLPSLEKFAKPSKQQLLSRCGSP